MATLNEFRKQFKQYTDHPGFSNIDVRAHCDCPNCGANMQLLWHFYPEILLKHNKGSFMFHSVEFYRKPDGEVIKNEL